MRALPQIPNIPAGWTPIQFWACPCERDNEGVVICQSDGSTHTRFVTWNVDLGPEGGCFWGHYTESRDKAEISFQEKKERHQPSRL